MLDSACKFVSSHVTSQVDASALVRDARRFSLRLPVVGRVAVPPPKQLAFYGVLAGLAAAQVVEWPVAVALGVGHALTTRKPEAPQQESPAQPVSAIRSPARTPVPSGRPRPRTTVAGRHHVTRAATRARSDGPGRTSAE